MARAPEAGRLTPDRLRDELEARGMEPTIAHLADRVGCYTSDIYRMLLGTYPARHVRRGVELVLGWERNAIDSMLGGGH